MKCHEMKSTPNLYTSTIQYLDVPRYIPPLEELDRSAQRPDLNPHICDELATSTVHPSKRDLTKFLKYWTDKTTCMLFFCKLTSNKQLCFYGTSEALQTLKVTQLGLTSRLYLTTKRQQKSESQKLQICASIFKTCRTQLLLISQVKKKKTCRHWKMRAERVIVLALIWTKWIPYVFRNTTAKVEPPCLSPSNTDRLLITTKGQSSCSSGAAKQDNLLTGMCGGTIKSKLQTLWESQKRHFCWNDLLCRSFNISYITLWNTHPFLFTAETISTLQPSSGEAPTSEVPNKVYICVSGGHGALHTAGRLIQVEDIISTEGSSFSVCDILEALGAVARFWLWAADTVQATSQVWVCFFSCVYTGLVTFPFRLDLRTPRSKRLEKRCRGRMWWRQGR